MTESVCTFQPRHFPATLNFVGWMFWNLLRLRSTKEALKPNPNHQVLSYGLGGVRELGLSCFADCVADAVQCSKMKEKIPLGWHTKKRACVVFLSGGRGRQRGDSTGLCGC